MFGCNYVDGDLEAVREMLENPAVISGLGDAGAHAKFICDGAMPSLQLAFWTRDRKRGPKMPLETDGPQAQRRPAPSSTGCTIAARSRSASAPTSTSSITAG